MKNFNLITFLSLILIFSLSAIGIQLVMEKVLAIAVFDFYFLLPASFILMGVIMLVVLNIIDKKNQKRLTQIILILKSFKIFVILFTGLFYVLLLDVNIRQFLIVTGMFYLIYLAFESVILFRFEKLLKKLNA